MASTQEDPRALLAKMEAEEKAAAEAAKKLAEDNGKKRKELLAKLREADLDDVKAKCKLHGFTASDLRGVLKTKGGGSKTAARKSTGGKTTTKRGKATS